jgi:hypothetical protein
LAEPVGRKLVLKFRSVADMTKQDAMYDWRMTKCEIRVMREMADITPFYYCVYTTFCLESD